MVSNLNADLRAVKMVAIVPMSPTARAMSLERIWCHRKAWAHTQQQAIDSIKKRFQEKIPKKCEVLSKISSIKAVRGRE
jgi:hypothetical protein